MKKTSSKRPLSGVLLFYKNIGMSSNDALQKVRRLYHAEKAGHAGTLDPFACGLLPILFGEATKFGNHLLDAPKTYHVWARFGFETDTLDKTGTPTRHASIPNLQTIDWQSLLLSLHGKRLQQPPIYSALKINGERAYDVARRGEIPELQAREIEIFHWQVLDIENTRVKFSIRCSKGTYIRSLVEELGRLLSSAAHADELERIEINQLFMRPELNLSTLQQQDLETLDSFLIPLESCINDLPKLEILPNKYRFIRNGNDIAQNATDGLYALYFDGRFFGTGRVRQNRVFPERLTTLLL